jgi:hypothetical protein
MKQNEKRGWEALKQRLYDHLADDKKEADIARATRNHIDAARHRERVDVWSAAIRIVEECQS